MNRNFTHLTIPAEIWLRQDISLQSKCLWAELRSLHDPSQGGCYASDEYLCNFLQLKRRRLYELYKELKDVGLMENVSFDGRKTIRRAIVPEVEYVRAQQVCTIPHTSSAENCTPKVQDPALTPYIENKEEKKDIVLARSAPRPRSNVPPISFSFDKKTFENITEADLNEWKKIFAGVDVSRELQLMGQWLLANPTRSKKKWRQFILNWLQANYEKITNKSAYQIHKQKTVGNIEENKALAEKAVKLFGGKRAREVSVRLEAFHNRFVIESTHPNCPLPSTEIYYTENGFREQINNALRKWRLKP